MLKPESTDVKCTRARAATRRTVVARASGIALALLAGSVGPRALAAQDSLARASSLYARTGTRVIATVHRNATVVLGATSGRFVQATVDGWIAAPFLGTGHDSLPLSVNPGPPVRLLADPSPKAPTVAELRAGMGLELVERRGAWVHVRRTGWLSSGDVTRAPVAGAPAGSVAAATPATPSAAVTPAVQHADTTPPVATQPPAPAPDTRAAAAIDSSRDGVRLTPIGETVLAAAPDGARVGTLLPGARASITGRDRGWVRVKVEGWAREADFSVADTAVDGTLSAADLRADPDGTAGKVVHWDIEVLAHQIADPLRKGLVDREPYLLAQGPGAENALLYLAISPALAATVAQIPDLAKAVITARVRMGRSEPVGVPVLELITIVRR